MCLSGVPLRIEVGQREVENGVAFLKRRDNNAASKVPIADLGAHVPVLLEQIQVIYLFTCRHCDLLVSDNLYKLVDAVLYIMTHCRRRMAIAGPSLSKHFTFSLPADDLIGRHAGSCPQSAR